MKDKAKENSDSDKKSKSVGRKRLFAYSLFLTDLKTRMYVAFDSTMKSEKEACDRALALLRTAGIVLDSLALDRYHYYQSYMDDFKWAKMFLIQA